MLQTTNNFWHYQMEFLIIFILFLCRSPYQRLVFNEQPFTDRFDMRNLCSHRQSCRAKIDGQP